MMIASPREIAAYRNQLRYAGYTQKQIDRLVNRYFPGQG